MSISEIVSIISLLAWLYLAFLHGKFWLPLMAQAAVKPDIWPTVDIIVPARDEAELLPGSLPSLLTQNYPGTWRIILVDDHSTDGTTEIARRIAKTKDATDRLMVIPAPKLAAGWTGKLAALHAGVALGSSEYILFTDADIYHTPGSLRDLVARAVENKFDLTSRMVKLHCVDFAEKLLIPAFVFFFAMLYPFRRSNDPDSDVAAAAGGVMLVRREAFNQIGGFTHIKSELIDDCALARTIKNNNGRIDLTMTEKVMSLRDYPAIEDIWRMIARTAYTQLQYSIAWLALTIAAIALLFLAPVLAILFGTLLAVKLGLIAWFIMAMIYLPMIHFHKIPFIWAAMLPAAAAVYAGAAIHSAWLFWHGKGGNWKGRSQA